MAALPDQILHNVTTASSVNITGGDGSLGIGLSDTSYTTGHQQDDLTTASPSDTYSPTISTTIIVAVRDVVNHTMSAIMSEATTAGGGDGGDVIDSVTTATGIGAGGVMSTAGGTTGAAGIPGVDETDDGLSEAVIIGASVAGGIVVVSIFIVILLMLIQSRVCKCCCCCKDDSPESGKLRPGRGAQDTGSLQSYGGSRRSWRGREREPTPGIENPVYADDKGGNNRQHHQHHQQRVPVYPPNTYELSANKQQAEANVHHTGKPPLNGVTVVDPHNVEIVTTPMAAIETQAGGRLRDSSDFYDDSEFDDFDYEYVPRGQQAPVQLTQHKHNRSIEAELRHHAMYASVASAVAASKAPDQPIYTNVETLKIRRDAHPEPQPVEPIEYEHHKPTSNVYPLEADRVSQGSNNSSIIMRTALRDRKEQQSPVRMLRNEDFTSNRSISSGYRDSSQEPIDCDLRRIGSFGADRQRSGPFSRGKAARASISRARSLDDLLEDKNAPIGIITVPGLHKNKFKSTPMIYNDRDSNHRPLSVVINDHVQPRPSNPAQNKLFREPEKRASPVAVLKPQRRGLVQSSSNPQRQDNDSPPPNFRAPTPPMQKRGRAYASTSVLNSSEYQRYSGANVSQPPKFHSTDNLLRESNLHRQSTPLYKATEQFGSTPLLNVAGLQDHRHHVRGETAMPPSIQEHPPETTHHPLAKVQQHQPFVSSHRQQPRHDRQYHQQQQQPLHTPPAREVNHRSTQPNTNHNTNQEPHRVPYQPPPQHHGEGGVGGGGGVMSEQPPLTSHRPPPVGQVAQQSEPTHSSHVNHAQPHTPTAAEQGPYHKPETAPKPEVSDRKQQITNNRVSTGIYRATPIIIPTQGPRALTLHATSPISEC